MTTHSSIWVRRATALLLLLACTFAQAEESYLGIFIQGSKVGYVKSTTSNVKLDGKTVVRSESNTRIDLALLGQGLTINQDTISWSSLQGAPLKVQAKMASAGREQKIDATFRGSEIAVTIDNTGTKSKKTLTIPKDGRYVDDPVVALLDGKTKAGVQKVFYSFDPSTASLERSVVRLAGPAKVTVKGITFKSTMIEVTTRQLLSKVFVSSKGDLIKAEMPMGMEMVPLSKAEALRKSEGDGIMDLAVLSRLELKKPLPEVSGLSSITLQVSGANLEKLPSDGHQTVTKAGNSWKVVTHAVLPDPAGTIQAARAAQPKWVAPGYNVPSGSETFVKLAGDLAQGSEKVAEAAEKIRKYVTGSMTPNAGIGLLRDATEVLQTKEGVCRDYAILTATLLRAAGIPTKLVSGLVYQDGAFYYHAWTEAFDGASWFGVDSTRPDGKVGAGHIKLADGTVESAFSFTFLDRAKVEVLETKKK